MSNKTKLLIVSSEFPPEPGGIGNHAYNLADHLSLHTFEVTVLTNQRNSNSSVEKKIDREKRFTTIRIKSVRYKILLYVNRILKILNYCKENETIIASGKFSLWFVAFSTFFLKRKYIAIIHGSEVNFQNSLLKKSINFSLKRFDKVISVSNYTKSLIKHLPLEEIVVIPNGFTSNSSFLENSKKLEGTPSLITVGNVTERKGQENVVLALPKLKKKFPKIHYHIVGIPTDKDKLLELAKKLHVTDHITFYGIVSEKVKYEMLYESDIFVMLSKNTADGDIEGFGIAILEANSLGTPAIGSKDCGIEDAINNEISGLLIPNNDPVEFENAIEKINKSYASYQLNSIKWSKKFNWEDIIKKYIKEITY